MGITTSGCCWRNASRDVVLGPSLQLVGTGTGVQLLQAVVGMGLVPNSSKIGMGWLNGVAPNRALGGPPDGMEPAIAGAADMQRMPAIRQVIGVTAFRVVIRVSRYTRSRARPPPVGMPLASDNRRGARNRHG